MYLEGLLRVMLSCFFKGRKISPQKARAYASKKSKEFGYKVPYLETSAKTGETIKKVFTDLVRYMVKEAEEAIEKKNKKK